MSNSFRLLGKCPNCYALDEITDDSSPQLSKYSRIKCDSCGTSWENWSTLKGGEQEKGNRLIPVDIHRHDNYCVELFMPGRREIPHSNLIITVLNSALMTRYGSDICPAAEGGLVKSGRRGYELRNDFDKIGLYADYGGDNARYAFNFYARMLLQLFQEPLQLGDTRFRRGEILRLEDKPEMVNDALIFLFATLSSIGGKPFAKKVLRNVNNLRTNPSVSRYIRGLSDEEIAKLFVPPPDFRTS